MMKMSHQKVRFGIWSGEQSARYKRCVCVWGGGAALSAGVTAQKNLRESEREREREREREITFTFFSRNARFT